MGYGSVIIVVGTIIVSGVLLLLMGSATSDADEELNEYHYKEFARDAAVTGLQLTVRSIAVDKTPGSWTNGADYAFATTSFGSGSFRTQVTPFASPGQPISGDTVDVVARGFNGPGRQVIFARYVREYADGGIPPSFRNAITTDFYLQLNGNVQILAIKNTLNATIHTNGNLETNGNSFLVEGYGTYTGSAFTNQEDNFVPNIDYNGADPNVFWADSVKIPPVDMNALRADAATSGAILNTGDGSAIVIDGNDPLLIGGTIDFTSPGTWPWAGTYDYHCAPGSCGTEEHPFIMVVEGPLNFVNRVRFLGYGVIAAAGNIYIDPQGNDGGVAGGLTPQSETKVILATPGNINIAGNAKLADGGLLPQNCAQNPANPFTGGVTLYAQAVLAPQTGVTFHGTPCLVGGIVAPETRFLGGGNPRITYASPSETITDPGFEYIAPIGPVLVSYSEW